MSRVKSGKETTQLLTVSKIQPQGEVVFDNIQGSGVLKKNSATIRFTLLKIPDCFMKDLFSCQVTYVNQSGERQSVFTMTGLGSEQEPPITGPGVVLPTSEHRQEFSPVTQSACDGTTISSFHVAELKYLAEKLARVEEKLESGGDRLEKKVENCVEATLERNKALVTEVTSRVSRLEDRLFSRVFPDQACPGTRHTDVKEALSGLESRLTQLAAQLDTMNGTRSTASFGLDQVKH